MRIESFAYLRERGWTQAFPDLDGPTTLVLVFGAQAYFDWADPIQEIAAAYPTSVVAGCSTSGEIHGTTLGDDSLVVAVVRFDATRLRLASSEIRAAESRCAGESLGSELDAPDLAGVLVLSDGLAVNGSDLAAGLNAALTNQVPVTGGLAGDGSRFERTWVLVDGKPAEGWATAIGLYGDAVTIGHGSQGGWDIFGPERQVTRSTGNVLYELDGRPALALYKRYLGDLAAGLPATALLFPLALRADGDDKQLVRTILSVDESEQSMTFAGDIPQGHRAQLMQANFDRVIGGAEAAARTANRQLPGANDVLCVAISCVGRRLVLGARTEEELEATLHILPESAVQVGFYSYGELSPYATGDCDLHNQTMTLTTISESS